MCKWVIRYRDERDGMFEFADNRYFILEKSGGEQLTPKANDRVLG